MDDNSLALRIKEISSQIDLLNNQRDEIDQKIKNLEDELRLLAKQLEIHRIQETERLSSWSRSSHHYQITDNERQEAYNSPQWIARRQIILSRDKSVCQCCNKKKAEEVHHINYYDEQGYSLGNKIWLSPDSNLVSLCSACHEKFKGTFCDDLIFIPANPPIKVTKQTTHTLNNLLLCNTDWNDVSSELRKLQLRYNIIENSIILAALYPEATKVGRKILFKEDIDDIDELALYKLIYRYKDERELNYTIRRLSEIATHHPSTRKNCSYFIQQLQELKTTQRTTPQKGIIVMASSNERRGQFIAIYDIEKSKVVKKYNFCNDENYKDYPTKKTPNILAQFYAIEYVMKRCMNTSEKTYELPIFPNDENGQVHLDKESLKSFKNRLSNKGIELLIKKKIEDIDFNNLYIFVDRWKDKVWGDIPTKPLRKLKFEKL